MINLTIILVNLEKVLFYYDKYFKESVKRKFIELSDWRPLRGNGWDRPLNLSNQEFYYQALKNGCDWIRWPQIVSELPPLKEMIDYLQECGIRFIINENWIYFQDAPVFHNVETIDPIMKVSKNLKISYMRSYPILNGMLYDTDLKRQNACRAIQMINEGKKIKDSIKQCGTSYKSICDYGYKGTGRQHPLKNLQRVKECLERIENGENLKKVLKEMKLGAWSYYRYRGLVY
jgi:hypothetical protein